MEILKNKDNIFLSVNSFLEYYFTENRNQKSSIYRTGVPMAAIRIVVLAMIWLRVLTPCFVFHPFHCEVCHGAALAHS